MKFVIGRLYDYLDFAIDADTEEIWAVKCIDIGQKTVEIPSTYNGKPVVGIYKNAFRGCSSLTTVVIPNTVKSIDENAFSCCNSLVNITIPNSVTSIGNYAFAFCKNLMSVTILDGVKSIGEYAFARCDSLTSVTIGKSITEIGSRAFYYCKNLRTMILNNNITIGDDLVHLCHNLYGYQSLDGYHTLRLV